MLHAEGQPESYKSDLIVENQVSNTADVLPREVFSFSIVNCFIKINWNSYTDQDDLPLNEAMTC